MAGVTFEDIKQQRTKPARARSTTPSPQNLEMAPVSTKLVSPAALDRSHRRLPAQAMRKLPFEDNMELTLGRRLTDPFFQDLNHDARFYISYFNHNVCKDFVIYDLPQQNPFRDLIPLATQHPVLLNIIIANSALNMANASQQSTARAFSLSPQLGPNPSTIPQLRFSPTSQSSGWYKDALVAKHRALRFLTAVLNDVDSTGIDIALGSVLLFTEFELADSGIKDWRLHMHGARALINSVKEPYTLQYANMSSLRRRLIANCLVYDVLSSTLARPETSGPPQCSSMMIRSSLQYAEVNNYLSFPAVLLERVLVTAQLSQAVQDTFPAKSITSDQEQQIVSLLDAAQSFDAREWASTLQSISPHGDLESRIHVASAHKAAVCIYISRVLRLLSPIAEVPDDLELLVSDIVHHLSFVTSSSELFKATSWPTFVAGADTRDLEQQAWAMARLRELWACLPCTMGYVRSAMEILGAIWHKRDSAMGGITHTGDWIQDLQVLEIDLMIA
ncbi:hypothetical protein BP6252_10847 [Coleophoma cylindrospora]|uniref:Acriflavine sensitivity control protein acr-2 n=1 Tax=Coleophoma cylindrospora TaxID=1849047 RepID=A0A3D8QNC9_9HELO|nr:hypothetical protein BP6252_10847 [Coleophoma cylindrospora]